MSREIVIWGAGGHAEVAADIVRLTGEHRLAGFLDENDPGRAGSYFCGATVLGGLEQLGPLAERGVLILPAIGDCAARLRIVALAARHGLELAKVIHPSAIVASGAFLGEGTLVAAGAIINPGARIGRAVIINTAASVDHHCQIGDGVHICPGVRLAGGVQVGAGTWVGLGALVCEKVVVGEHAVIGAGSVVLREVARETVVVGNPAQYLRKHPAAAFAS